MNEIWVVDTSSIIEVRRKVQHSRQRFVFDALTDLVNKEVLVYPKKVVEELAQICIPNSENVDLPLEWAKQNQAKATRFPLDYMVLKEILAHPQVQRVLDPDKVGVEEADPYVLTLALQLSREGFDVRVLVEETRDRPDKLSMNTACGHLRLISLKMSGFLEEKGIWRP